MQIGDGDMSRKKRLLKFVSMTSLTFFLLNGQLAFSLDPTVSVIGDVVGKGRAEMKTAFDRWISISGKAFPLFDGGHLRSGDGMMSSIFRDGARMEVGKNSELIVTGSRGDYTVDLSKGNIAFSVPQRVSFSVATLNATIQTQVQPNIIRQVSAFSDEYVRGSVGFDSRGTMVTAVSGTLMVKDTKGAAAHTVTAGNSIFVPRAESGHRAAPAQLVPTAVNVSPGAASFSAAIGSRPVPLCWGEVNSTRMPQSPAGAGFPSAAIGSQLVPVCWIIGGSVFLMGAAYLWANSETNRTGGVASPSSP